MDRFSAHLDRGWDLIAQGDTTRALIAARRALELNEESPEVHNLLGYIHALDGDLDEALVCYRHAMELDEWFLDPLLNAAEILCHPDADPEEAIELCRQAAEICETPEEIAERVFLEVDALLNLGRNEEALARLSDIEDPEVLSPSYLTMLGRAYFELMDLDKAKPAIARAIELDPRNPDAWYYKGLIARDEGRRIDAVIAFLATLEGDKEAPTPPWLDRIGDVEDLVRKAIATLPAQARRLLEGTVVTISDSPSEGLIRRELDPRLALVLEGIDPHRGCYETLHIFRGNLARTGCSPSTLVEDIARLIHHEAEPNIEDD